MAKRSGNVDSVLDSSMGCLARFRSGCLLVGFNLFFLFFIVFFAYLANRDYQLDKVGVITTGVVIDQEESDSAESGCCVYAAIVEFNADGQSYTFTSGNAYDPPRYEIGEQVNIQYDPGNPERAEIEGGTLSLLWVGLIVLFTVLLVGMNIWGGVRIWRGQSLDD